MKSSLRRSASSAHSSACLRAVMSSMARRIRSYLPSGGGRRALSIIVLGPMGLEVVLHLTIVEGAIAGDDLLEQRPQCRDVPLAVPQVVDESAFRLGGRDVKGAGRKRRSRSGRAGRASRMMSG